MQNLETGEYWSWRSTLLAWSNDHSPLQWIIHKIIVVINVVLSFFLITSVTAIIVRVLLSSGVVIMFGIFACLRMLGAEHTDGRLLAMSYPWIGREVESLERDGIYPKKQVSE